MPTLTVSPNPSAPNSRARVDGIGFDKYRTRLDLDGVVVAAPFRPAADGSFHVGVPVGEVGSYALVAKQYRSKKWDEVTRTTVTVAEPPPSDRPFAAPVTTRTVSVPSSIDSTGATNVGAALNAFIATVPNGSIISFTAGDTYKMETTIRFSGRNNLIFEGNGATLLPVGQADSSNNSAFALWNLNTDIVIRNFTIVGQGPGDGVYRFATNENRYGVLIYGGKRTEISNVTMRNIWADYVTVAPSLRADGGQTPAEDVWIHDSTLTGAGRMGVSVISAFRVLIERNTFDRTAWVTLDIEPNNDCQDGVGWVTFRNNRILRGGTNVPGFVSAMGGTVSGPVHDIVISGNRTDQTLDTDITHLNRRRNVVFTNNTALKSAAGPVLNFAHIDGLTVTGNVQPLSSGSLMSVTDCTSVVT